MKITAKELKKLITEEVATQRGDELCAHIDSAMQQLALAERVAQYMPDMAMEVFLGISDALKVLRKLRSNTMHFRRNVREDPRFASLETLRKDRKHSSFPPPGNHEEKR